MVRSDTQGYQGSSSLRQGVGKQRASKIHLVNTTGLAKHS